ncbi:MAG: hypothetical protein HY674_22380 [Chloroflexi bacterium]|nr:hypothetical protein [Chloroflexota bacterium]
MTSKQENKLSMYLAVKAVCDRNTSTWQTLQAFADGYTEFGAHLQNIQTLSQSQSQATTGLAADKQQLREAMAAAAVEIAGAASAYAKKVKNNDLAAKVNVSVSDIMGGRDTTAADTARNVHAAATANLANLGSYGITAAKLTALKGKIDAYAASISKPRDARASTKTATEQMSAEFDAADAALADQMDSLMPQFQPANAAFVTDYQNARITVRSGGGGKSKPTPPPTPPNP